jgi:serine/threonine protein kinase/Flp pilus assembly protein TadD
MSLAPGSRVGPYEIVAPIGAGGMGEVYRARDTRLGRDVAIKVLPVEFASDPERLRRFEQEARAVAALDHPNILALYDVGTHEGSPYIVTQLLEGESLRERLSAGALPVRKAVETAVQIAQGLAAAHAKGIVHRDLKPGNVFLTKDGVVKILDFGIAKLVEPRSPRESAQATTLVEATEAGTTLGTVGYMSPEQVRGQSVDHRSDIFSLGCVLYELLSGRSPFRRDTAADTASAILHEEPPGLASGVRNIPPALEGLVTRCLEKSPEDRFQSARDLAHDLSATMPDTSLARPGSVVASTRKWRSFGLALVGVAVLVAAGVLVLKLKLPGPSNRGASRPKIVVLPFENLGAPEDAYFAAGMTEEITSRLANVQGLGVISRTSAMEYTRRGKTVKEIGSELGVDYVLEGSVRWERGQGRESRVRITPQLIRVADDTHVWADRYERVLEDVFAMQSEVAENAVKAMGVTLLPRERTALKNVSTSDMEAYDLYLRGQELFSGGNDRQQVEGALHMYQAAADRDPRFAQALAGIARMHLLMYWDFFDRSPERLAKGKVAAERAVELRPDLAEPHAALGFYFYHGLLDYPRALKEFGAALKLQPGNADVLLGIGAVLRRQGRWSEAADAMAKAVELDPRNTFLLDELGGSYWLARRYSDAGRAFERAIAMRPQWAEPYHDAAFFEITARGDLAKAHSILEEAGRVAGLRDDDKVLARAAVGIMRFRRDYEGALRQLEAEARETTAADQYSFSTISLDRGLVHTWGRHQDLARRSFEAARVELERKVAQDPDDYRLHSSLGIAYAGLGRRDDAVREARIACDLMPASKDALRALSPVSDLATVYTMVGQTGEAIATLDDLLARSGLWSVYDLRLGPTWDPLRSDPRFQALLTKYEVKP